MYASYILVGLRLLLLLALLKPTQGGNCWSAMIKNGRCTELFDEKVSKEECCAFNSVATAWSEEDLDPGTLFFWRVLGGGVRCQACKESCAGVQCGEGKKCVLKRGRPKCVCSPDCRGKSRHKGPVCGSDGRTYRTVCRLRKRACRRRSSTLVIAYYGQCQSSCETIQCPAGKQCLQDQNMTPHCVKCTQRCPQTTGSGRQVCGSDGVTYQSACHLREAACHKGKAIPVAYKGRCKQAASCETIHCKDRKSCLLEMETGAPRCVTCGLRCPRPRSLPGQRHDMGGPICGTNNRTYHSWCHMLKDACATGYVIETKYPGACDQAGNGKPSVGNTVLDQSTNSNQYS